MINLSQTFWTRSLVLLSGLTFIFGAIHLADNVVNDDMAFDEELFILLVAAVLTLQLFATFWTWAGKRYGYVILGLVSLGNFYAYYLSHLLEAQDARGHAALAAGMPAGWRPVYVVASLYGGAATAAIVIIVVYLLIKYWQPGES